MRLVPSARRTEQARRGHGNSLGQRAPIREYVVVHCPVVRDVDLHPGKSASRLMRLGVLHTRQNENYSYLNPIQTQEPLPSHVGTWQLQIRPAQSRTMLSGLQA